MTNTTNSSLTIDVNSVLNMIALLMDVIVLLICIMYFCIIIYRIIESKYKHGRRSLNVSLVLSINIILVIFIKSLLQIVHITYPTLVKNLGKPLSISEPSVHRMRAYMLWSMYGVLYWSYTLVAFYRFVRVIYSTKLWLHRLSLYVCLLIPGEYLFVYSNMLIILFGFRSINMLPDEAYFSIIPIPFYSLLFASFIIFIVPFHIVCLFYYLIVKKMRETTMIRQEHDLHRRDFVVLRRMAGNLIILGTVIIIYIIIVLKGYIENRFDSLMERIQWLSSSSSSFTFAITLPFITPKLREFLKQNRLMPVMH
ncbi:hypothetical protein I4U23_020345 [Adineta vaga]|nr:hypothetical protein I4U23_020345 [Adineta vaga]